MFNWLLRKQKAGYVPDTMDARDAQYELLFTGEKDLPKHYSWEKRLPFFRLQMWYPFCFKGSTKVVMEDFTEKPIRDIKIGEYVRTHTGIRKQVTEVMRRKWQGKVIKMRVYGVAEPIVCTLEHPFYVYRNNTYQWIEAKELTEDDRLVMPYSNDTREPTCERYKDPDFLYLLGVYLAEGSLSDGINKKLWIKKRVNFTLGAHCKEYIQRTIDCIKNVYGIEPCVYENKANCCIIEIASKSIAIFDDLLEHGSRYCDKKRLSNEMMFLSPELQKHIYQGWADGDGHVEGNKTEVCSTSYELIRQMQTILNRNKIASSIIKRKKQKDRKQAWSLIQYGKNGVRIVEGEEGIHHKIRSLEEEAYMGCYVYNLEVEDDHSYQVEGLATHNCVSFATTTLLSLFEKEENKRDVVLSPYWLFYSSYGSKYGSSIRENLSTAQGKGCVLDSRKPMPKYYDYSYASWGALERNANDGLVEMDYTDALHYKIKSYSAVDNHDRATIKSALMHSPLIVAYGIGKNYNDPYPTTPDKITSWHCVLLIGWDEHDNWQIRGSLSNEESKWLDKNYEIPYIYSVRDLPEEWREKQQDALDDPFYFCLHHYNKKRQLRLEQQNAILLTEAVKKLKNHSVYQTCGKFFLPFVNAITYGHYTITDIINSIYAYRRTGKFPFNFNEERKK